MPGHIGERPMCRVLAQRSLGHIFTNIHEVSKAELENTQSFVCSFNGSSTNVAEISPDNHFYQADSNIFFSKCINEVVIQ